MKLSAAIQRARKWARKKGIETFVFLEDSDTGDYEVGDEYDLDTWYAGQDPIYCFGPDGECLN
jgi:hypothetical protein